MVAACCENHTKYRATNRLTEGSLLITAHNLTCRK